MSKYYKMFKAYDVRALVPDIDEKLFYWAGYSFVKDILIPQNLPTKVNLMHDTRRYSPKFYQFLAQGIQDAGGEPIALGFGSTDMLYVACVFNGNPGIEVTASHNPKDYHGLKIVKQVPDMLGLDYGLSIVRDFVVSKENEELIVTEPAFAEKVELKTQIMEFYKQKIREVGDTVNINKQLKDRSQKLKIAVDAGNGMGGMTANILKEIYPDIEFVPLYWDLDGNFPNHEPNPELLENYKDLQKSIMDEKADFGVFFDGDGDRAVVLTEEGEIIKGDYLVSIFAKTMLKDYNNGKLGSDLSSCVVYVQPGSRCTVDSILQNGGIAVPSKQGHTFIKMEMKKTNALYGGEFSGHHYFGTLKGMDSGALPVALFIKLFIEDNVTKVADLYKDLAQNYFISPLMNLQIAEGDNFENWKQKLAENYKDATISYLDGISVFYSDWKFSMRASNTEPIVRFILETRVIDKVEEKLAEIKKIVGIL